MSITNSSSVKIAVGGTDIEDLSSVGIDFSMSTRDITTKDSSGDREIAEGLIQVSLSFEGLHDPAATTGFESLQSTFDSRSSITWKYSSGVVGDTEYSGSGYITGLSLSAGTEDNHTFTGSIEGTGAVTATAIT